MIFTRTPLRISLFGGGTDYPEFCDRKGGMVLGGTIDKFVYITASKLFQYASENLRLSYRETESVCDVKDIKHPIVREYLKKAHLYGKYAFYTVSDIPGGSGLGSSSSFSVGFIKLVHYLLNNETDAEWLAREAIDLERNILNENVGLQDQYHAAFGGFSKYSFHENQTVSIQAIPNLQNLNSFFKNHSALIFTGKLRSASVVLEEQVKNTKNMTKDAYLDRMKEICGEACQLFEDGLSENKVMEVGKLLRESWKLKTQLSSTVSSDIIDELMNDLISIGATGAKVLGAGGGGFVLAIGDGNFKERALIKYGDNRVIDFKFISTGCELFKSA